MFDRLTAYLDSVRARDPSPRSRWEILIYPGVWALGFHRFAHWLYEGELYFLARLVNHTAVEACCVTGANLGQPLALLMLNAEALQMSGEPGRRSELAESLASHLAAVNAGLDPHERLDCLVVVSEAWTVDNDLVTPTLKVKRNRVEARYAHHYEGWVGARRPVIWQ